MSNNDVTVSIITYNSEFCIQSCLESIDSPYVKAVNIIDNGSTDLTEELAMKYAESSNTEIGFVNLGRNYGYGFACNKAIEIASTPYVLLLNADVKLGRGAIEILLSGQNIDNVVTVPRILKEEKLQLSLRKFPTPKRTALEAIFGFRIMNLFGASEIVSNQFIYETNSVVDWASGACWMVNRHEVISVGMFSTKWFLYSEETELAYRINMANKNIVYMKDAVINHSTGNQHKNKYLFTLAQANKIRYLNDILTKKFTYVYVSFLIGQLLRAFKTPNRYCLKMFLKYPNRMEPVAMKMIEKLDGVVPF